MHLKIGSFHGLRKRAGAMHGDIYKKGRYIYTDIALVGVRTMYNASANSDTANAHHRTPLYCVYSQLLNQTGVFISYICISRNPIWPHTISISIPILITKINKH